MRLFRRRQHEEYRDPPRWRVVELRVEKPIGPHGWFAFEVMCEQEGFSFDRNPPASGPEVAVFVRTQTTTAEIALRMAERKLRALGYEVYASRIVP